MEKIYCIDCKHNEGLCNNVHCVKVIKYLDSPIHKYAKPEYAIPIIHNDENACKYYIKKIKRITKLKNWLNKL